MGLVKLVTFQVGTSKNHEERRQTETMSNGRRSIGDDDKGLLWRLPKVRIKDVGKVGPAFGLGFGCGFGFGAGLIGGNLIAETRESL